MPCRSYLPCWSQWNFSVWQSTFHWYFCTAKLYFDLLVAVNSIGYWQTQISFVPPLSSFHVFLLYKTSSCKQSVNTFLLGDAIFCILRELVDIKQKYKCVSGLEYFVLKMLDFLHWPELLIFTCSWLTFFVFIVSWPLIHQIGFLFPSNFPDRAIGLICVVCCLFLPVVWHRCSGADAITNALWGQCHRLPEAPPAALFPGGPDVPGSDRLRDSDNGRDVSDSALSDPSHTTHTELEL